MIIKTSKPKKIVNKNSINIKSFIIINLIFLIFGFLFLFLIIKNTQNIRDLAFQKGFRAINPESVGSAIKRFPKQYFKSKFTEFNSDIPKLIIDINFKNFKRLEKKVNTAKSVGIIIQEENDLVPATLRINNKSIKAKIRIKGDNLDHLIGNKWSFRIETSKDDALFGMRRFSLQNPVVRGFQGQYLIDQTRKMYDLVSLNRLLVDVIVNGEDVGIMEIEEHFSKELLERNERKESVIIKFDESEYFELDTIYNYTNSVIDVFRKGTVEKNQILKKYNEIATGLLRSFVDGELLASEVFDEKEMGMFYAINRVWGADHGNRWGNLRFYYNPYVGKLQPIGYDDNFHERLDYSNSINDEFFSQVIKDRLVYREYLKSLKKLTQDILEGNLISKLNNLEKIYSSPLFSEFYFLQPYDYSDLKKRAIWISKNVLNLNINQDKKYSVIRNAHIYLVKNIKSKNYDLQFSSAIPKKVIIKDVMHTDLIKDQQLKFFFKPYLPINLEEKKLFEKKKYKIIFDVPEDLLIDAEFLMSTNDDEYLIKHKVHPYYESIKKPLLIKKNISKLEEIGLIDINQDKKIITFNKGKWNVSETIHIADYNKIIFNPGVELFFEEGAGLISEVPVEINGKNEKVKFQGDGNSGWFYLINALNESFIDGLLMDNVVAVNYNGIELVGAFSVYNSKINIKNLIMNNVLSEDGLNMIHSDFKISDSLISNTNSDAIDSDFSKGTIINSKFYNIGILGGGDAIDVSGSSVIVEDTYFNVVSDKAISVGEKSEVKLINVNIENSSVGVASKDLSLTTIIDSSIKNSKFADLMAYKKKK